MRKLQNLQLRVILTGWRQQKNPALPSPIYYIPLYYRLWTCGIANCVHDYKGEWVTNIRKVTTSLACEGESGQAPDDSEGNLKPDPEGGTESVAREGDTTKSEFLTYDPSGMSTINCHCISPVISWWH